jgi:hypothetical protein
MTQSSKKEDVQSFLKDFSTIAQTNLQFIPTRKNKETLLELGLTKKLVQKTLLTLNYVDYSAGPIRDTDPTWPGYVWIFGTDIEKTEIYIKLKVEEENGQKISVCLSFHEAERPLTYPFKEHKKEGATI